MGERVTGDRLAAASLGAGGVAGGDQFPPHDPSLCSQLAPNYVPGPKATAAAPTHPQLPPSWS